MMSFLLTNKGAHMYNGNIKQCVKCKKFFNSEKTLLNHKCSHCVTCRQTYCTYQRFSTHVCKVTGSAHYQVVQTSNFSSEKLRKLIKRNELTNDDTICYISGVLKSTFPEVLVGVIVPAEVEVLLNYTVKPQPRVPVDRHSVNIHYTTEHWITSWQDPCTNTIHVFDSLTSTVRLQNIMPILKLFYHVDQLSIVYEECVSQQTLPNCGLYAATYAYYCCRHINPKYFVFVESQLRNNVITFLFPVSQKETLAETNVNFHEINTKSQDRKRKKLARASMTQEQIHKQRLIDKERKQKARDARTEEQIERDRQRNQQIREQSRIKINPQQIILDREKNRQSQKCSRVKRTQEQLIVDKRKNKESRKVSRDKMTQEQVTATRQNDKESHNVLRHKRSQEQVSVDRGRNRESQKVSRGKRSREQVSADRGRNRESQKVSRGKRSKEEISVDRERNRESHKVSRGKRSQEEISVDRGRNRESHKISRGKRSQEEISVDRGRNRESHKISRGKRSQEEISVDRGRNRESPKVSRGKRSQEEISVDRGRNRESHKVSRGKRSQEQVSVDRGRNRESHKVSRGKRSQEQVSVDRGRNRESHKVSRGKRTPEQVSVDRGRNRESQKQARYTQSENQRERAKSSDRTRKAASRHPSDVKKAISNFKSNITLAAEYVCSVCHRSLFRNSVKVFKPESDIAKETDTNKISPDGQKYICITCHRYIHVKMKIPPQAQVNKMAVPETPEVLNLTAFETRLLARRYPFMKVVQLPKGKQRGIIGRVVNIPVDANDVCSSLPRTLASSGILQVKLKRKKSFKGHVTYQNIRPDKVKKAFQWLLKNNRHYQNVVENFSWDSTSDNDNSDVWQNFVEKETELPHEIENDECDTVDGQTQSSDSSDSDSSDEYLVTPTQSREETQFDTCIQSSDPAADASNIVSISPGEGQHPIHFFMDPGCEEQSFPSLFPTGCHGFDAGREIRISPKKYFNARILNYKGTFGKNLEYLFFAQYVSEYKQVMDSVSIAVRKSFRSLPSDNPIDAAFIKNPDKLKTLILKDRAYQFLQTVRGSPPYWQKCMYKLMAAVKQFGIFTFFVTLSAADSKWPDSINAILRPQGKQLTEEDIQNLSWEEKSKLLQSNPVTLARHFDHRLHCFFQNILLSPAQPLGKVIHYSYRIEFQQRGSPHAHCVIWVENAPTLNNSYEDIASFIDRHITCEIPLEEEEPELYNLVTTVQQHHHTATCRKKGTDCRFGFPKLPSFYTLIASEVESDDQVFKAATLETAADILTTVFQTLNNDKEGKIDSLEGLLLEAGISEEQYMYALSIAKRGKQVVLQRKINEYFVNPYNKHLLLAWQANLDVQFCLDPYACIAYMVSYITKDEREMSTVLKNVSKEVKCHGWRDQLKACANAFLNARELSAQEAVYRLLSFPLFNSNFSTVFVPAALPEKRVAFLKPQQYIQSMDDEDDNVFTTSIIDRYAARPNHLQNMCLAQFAINYSPCKSKNDTDQNNEMETTIQLNNGLGSMKKNSKHSVLRYHHYSILKEPEEYHYSQLLLFLPWTKESDLIQLSSYADHFEENNDTIQENRSEIEHHAHIIEEAVERLEQFGPPVHAFDTIAPSTIQENDDHAVTEDEQFALLNPGDSAANVQIPTDIPVAQTNSGAALEIRPGYWPENQYCCHIRHLNTEQRNIFQTVFQWCQQKMLSCKTQEQPDQLLLFVSGGAGTGKSHLISAIYQMALRTLQVEGENPDNIRVLLTAPTGTAAHNISGTTLHSAFLLPLGQTKSYIKLSDDKRNTLRAKVGNLDLLIIDEISMVGSNLLLQLHYRLSEIKSCTKLFGGVAVIVLGDLYQLPPVKQQFVFKPVSDHISRLFGSLWDCFTFTELTRIMRQKDDLQFAQLLNRIRLNEHTAQDVQILESRKSEDTNFSNILHVYARNCDVDSHNQKQLGNLDQPMEHFIAIDRKPESLKNFKIQQDSKYTGGLPNEIILALGARVMLIRNINIADGLVNGSQGQIVTFVKSGKGEIVAIGVKFDNPKVGEEARQKSPYVLELQSHQNATPILRTETTFTVTRKNKNLTVNRYQFPLKLAWACTIHKVQGLTVDEIVVSFEGRFGPGQAYVALSRARSLAGLHIISSFDSKKITINSFVQTEMERLRNDKSIPVYYDFLTLWKDTIIVSMLNIRSYNCHKVDLIADPIQQQSDINILTETWLNAHNADFREFAADFNIYRSDKQSETNGRGGGVAVLIRHTAFSQCSLVSTYSDVLVQINTCKLVLTSKRTLYLIAVYNSPASTHAHLETVLMAQIRHVNQVGCSPSILIAGDFNQNVKSDSPAHICHTLTTEGFKQYVSTATHSSGSCLDHLYLTNLRATSYRVTPAYYSDHKWVSSGVRFQ